MVEDVLYGILIGFIITGFLYIIYFKVLFIMICYGLL